MNKVRSKRGFTLIELLVVISIIGVLASIVLAALGTTRTKAKNARIQQETQSLRTAIELTLNGSSYNSLLSDNGNGSFNIAFFDSTTMGANIYALASDILIQNSKSYAGGAPTGCLGQPVPASYPVEGGASPNNGLTIFTNTSTICANPQVPVNATKYAIFSAYTPVGTAGYFCIDSSGKTVNNSGAVGIPAAPGANTTCI